MKVSISSKNEPNTKVKKIEEKLISSKAEISFLKQELRKERKRKKAIINSRNNWKKKNAEKAKKLKGLKQQIQRQNKPKRHQYDLKMIKICVLLRTLGGCSYRSIQRILTIFQFCSLLENQRLPCANTVQNWVSKLGLYQLENVVEPSNYKEVCIILDENLKAGNERVMLMLLTDSEKQKSGSLKYEDTDILFIGGKKSWTGEKIAKQLLEKIETSKLKITHILSDEDSKLRKATALLEVQHLPDINHAIATCLRKTFKKDATYQAMIKLISGYSAKSVNQDLSYLRPPKQRVKARFMNQKPFIDWGLTILLHFDKLNKKEQLFFKELKNYQAMLNKLKQCIQLSEQIVKPLKEKGLNTSTLKEFELKIKQLKQENQRNEEDKLIINFANYLENYANQYHDFLKNRQGNFNVSSDIIESLFSKQKRLVSSNPLTGVSILDLELPVHCIAENKMEKVLQPALEDVFISSLFKWKATHSSDNQALKRMVFFKKRA